MLWTHSFTRRIKGLTRAWWSGFTGTGTLSIQQATHLTEEEKLSLPFLGAPKDPYCPLLS